MATRRSKKNIAAEKLSGDEGETSKNVEITEGSVPETRTSARILRSKGRNANKENSFEESTKTDSAKQKGVGNSPGLSPSKKRSRTASPNKRVSKAMRIPAEDEEEEEDLEGEGQGEEEEEDNDESVAEENQLTGKTIKHLGRDTSVIELSSDDAYSPPPGKEPDENLGNSLESDEEADDPKEVFPSKFTDTTKDLSAQRYSTVPKPSIMQDPKRAVTIQVKKVVKGVNEGEIEVVTSYEEHVENSQSSDAESKDKLSPEKVTRTYPGPTRKVSTVTKTEGRKYMILDKATIKGMMEKGLIQAINKDGSSQQNVTYRAILPKAGPSILRRVGAPGARLKSPPGIKPNILSKGFIRVGTGETDTSELQNATLPMKTSITVGGSSTVGATIAPETASPGTRVQIPSTSIVGKASGSGVGQVITSPVFVKSPNTAASVPGSNPGNMQVVTLPPNIVNQLQKGGPLVSLAMTDNSTGEKTVLQTGSTGQGIAKTSSRNTFIVSTAGGKSSIQSEDLDDPDLPVDASDSGEEEDKDVKYGVPTGVCKVLKSMKMYQFVDKGSEEKGPRGQNSGVKNSHNVRWVAVPNDPGEPRPDFGPKLQRCTPPILPISVPPIVKEPSVEVNEVEGKNKKALRRLIKDMKLQHARLIGKHRTRFSRLQKKYSELEKDFKEVEDVGTPQQIVRDCRKHLSEEHSLFMESQMFWKNLEGKGNRFSKRFLLLMLDLYHKSPAGYRYLKTVFTLPSIKLLLKLESQGFGNRSLEHDRLTAGSDSNVQTPEGESSVSPDIDEGDSNLEPPVSSVNIKSELPVMAERDSLTMPTDSKDWFKSDMIISESLPSTSGQTVFLSSSVKESLLRQKRPDEDEDDDSSSHHGTSDNLELSEVGSAMTTFDNISKKVVVVPDNGSLNKQEITIQWDEAWGPL